MNKRNRPTNKLTPPPLDAERIHKLEILQRKSNLRFADISLLDEAFTHRSFSNESDTPYFDNERLELLGDSVLGLITVEFLFKKFPKRVEGKLSRMKSKLVSAQALSRIAEQYHLLDYLRLGKGEKASLEENKNIKADLVEAMLGAIYLDQGLSKAREFIVPALNEISEHLDTTEGLKDYKTLLQEYCQKKYKTIPSYSLVKEEGLDHDKEFTICVALGGIFKEIGKGKNKRSAEQNSANNALKFLGLV